MKRKTRNSIRGKAIESFTTISIIKIYDPELLV